MFSRSMYFILHYFQKLPAIFPGIDLATFLTAPDTVLDKGQPGEEEIALQAVTDFNLIALVSKD